jgi:hypothetical protein
MRTPQVTIPFVNQGSKEAMMTSGGDAITMTINGSRVGSTTSTVTLTGPRLYARTTASPYQARPFMLNTPIINPTNTTNATVDIADADAGYFEVGDACTFYDVSAGALSTETKVISAIGAAGSGGTGETLITFTGVWTTPPVATDRLCVADGTELSANAVVVLDDIEFDGSSNFLVNGYINGVFKAGKVNNTTYFDNTKAPNIQFVNMS